jgi:hypothetical protein
MNAHHSGVIASERRRDLGEGKMAGKHEARENGKCEISKRIIKGRKARRGQRYSTEKKKEGVNKPLQKTKKGFLITVGLKQPLRRVKLIW